MTADMCTPNPGGAINPDAFPIPTVSPAALEGLASRLRDHGTELAGVGQDIKSHWGGLSSCYKAPEAETLFSVVDPVASDGDEVETSMSDAATALEDFAERARDIKSRWNTLKADANAFLATIDTSTDEWREAEGWWDRLWGKESGNVGRNNELHTEAAALQQEYEEAERDCANAINAGIVGRTNFVAGDLSGEQDLGANDYVHGYEGDLSEVPMAWGAPVETDHGWWVDASHAVWDFGVGAAEGLGGMVGAYSSEGWFEASWGDALWEHWEGTAQSAASLVGMYDAEADSWGWSGLDSVGTAWKDAAHAVVPWEEWGDRPGYVIGTALLNIGATVGGALLTATGVGAVVGVPLMAWRGAAILDKMGGSRVPDLDVDGLRVDVSNGLPRYGNPNLPNLTFDLSNLNPLKNLSFSPSQLTDLRGTLDRLMGLNLRGDHDAAVTDGDQRRTGGSDDTDADADTGTQEPTVEQVTESRRLLNELGLDPSLGRTFDDMETTAGNHPAWEMSQYSASAPDASANPARVPAGVGARADAAEAGASPDRRVDLTGTRDGDLPDDLDGPDGLDIDASNNRPVVTNSVDNSTGTAPRNGTGDTGGIDVRENGSGPGDTSGGRPGPSTPPPGRGGLPGGLPGDEFDVDRGTDRPDRDGQGDGPDPDTTELSTRPDTGRTITEARALLQDQARGILDGVDLGEGPTFVRNFVDAVNTHFIDPPANTRSLLLEAFYDNRGYRYRTDTMVQGETIPSLIWDGYDRVWTSRDALPPAAPPRYADPAVHGTRDGVPESTLGELDGFAERRDKAITDHKPFNDKVREYKADFKADGSDTNRQLLEDAREQRRPYSREVSESSEDFGEAAAEQAVRENFDGNRTAEYHDPALDENGNPRRDDEGNEITRKTEVELPNLRESTPDNPNPLDLSEYGPGNGNDQFDQIWETEDGGYVIVEAKSSLTTELGDRVVTDSEGRVKKVKQGTREYFEDILREMEERGGREEKLVQSIRRQMTDDAATNKVHYVEAKGNPAGGRYEGNSLRLFDIRK